MSPRIQELAEQCHHRYSQHNIDLAKFAELIVKECADYIDAFNKETMVDEGIDGNGLKQHFGVEL